MVQDNFASRAILSIADSENADSRQAAKQHNAPSSIARKETSSETACEPDPAVQTSTVCEADRGSSRQETHSASKATLQNAEQRQIVTTAKCFIAPGLLALQEANRTLRQHQSLETIFDSDYLTTHETLPPRSLELRSRKGGLPNHASASTAKNATALDVGQLKVSNLSPLEGLRSRFMRSVAKLVPPLHRYAVEPQGRSARCMAQSSGTCGWTELRAPLDLRAAVESWNHQRGPEYTARLQIYLDQLVQIRSKMEEPSCTLAVHALWDLSVCEGNRLTMQSASGVSAALVSALSDESAVYARGTSKGETNLLRVQQAAGNALFNLCCEPARGEFILELHRMRALSKCIEALSHLGMEACLVNHEGANGESQHADASAADTLCSLAAVLSTCLPGPDAKETEGLLQRYGNFVLCVMHETQRPKVFSALTQTLCTWLDPERFSRSSGTANLGGDDRCSLILCSLLSVIIHHECATDQDRFAVLDMAAQCVTSQQGAVADLFSGIYLSSVSGSSHSRHEGYQVINLSMMYHLARCLHFCLSAHLQKDFDDPLKEDVWIPPAELSKHSCFDGAHDSQGDSDSLYRELAAERCLAALQGLTILHARRSKILPPLGTLVFLWRLLIFVFDVAPIFRERTLQTLAGCCFLENFMEVMPYPCAARLASIIQDVQYHGNTKVAILLHNLCSSLWGCKFLCIRNDGLCTLLRHIEAAQDSEVCILLASAVEKFSSHIVRDDFLSEQSNKASELLETSTVKAEWMRWARGLDRISAHKILDRFGALSMDIGDDFDEPCFSLHLRPDAWDVNVQDCMLPSTDSIGLLCQLLRNSSKIGPEHDSSKVVESLSNAVQMFCATEHLLSKFDRATTKVLLDSTTGCLRAGVKSFGNLLHAIESIAQSEKGIAVLDSQLEKISCIVQAALYLQAQDAALQVFRDLADGSMRLVWKLVRAGSNLEADGQLLSIVYYGAIQPGLGLTQRQACANMLLDLFLRKDAPKISNTRRRQLFGLVSDGDDASLVACLELLHAEDLKLQIIGAQFISHGAWTGATSTQAFIAAAGLRALVEMAWQSRNVIARQEGLRALLELSTKHKSVQIALAREAILELILLAKHVAVVSKSGVQEKEKKGEDQVEEREEEQEEEEEKKNKKEEKVIKRASKSTESHHKQYLQRCLSQIITALQSNHKNRTLLYQTELRLSMDASLAFETHQLPWTIEDDEDSLKGKNQSRCQDLQTSTTSVHVEYQNWMSAAFRESSLRNHLHAPARPVPQKSSRANGPGRKRRPPMQQRRLLYKSAQSLWKPTTQATDGGSRWEPHIVTAEISAPSPTAEQNLVPQILEERDGSGADHGESVQLIQDNSVLVKRDQEEEEKGRHAILQSLGIQLRDASRGKKLYRVMTDRMYTFASNDSSLKARALVSASSSSKPGMSLFHHVLGSKVSDTCGLKKVQLDEENVVFVYTTTEPAIPLLPRAHPGPVPSNILCTPTFEDFQRTSIGLLYRAGTPTMSALKSAESFIPRTTRRALAPSECVFTRFGEYLRAKQLQAPWDKYGTLNATSFAIAIISPSLYKLIREKDGETSSDNASSNEGFTKSFRRRGRSKLK